MSLGIIFVPKFIRLFQVSKSTTENLHFYSINLKSMTKTQSYCIWLLLLLALGACRKKQETLPSYQSIDSKLLELAKISFKQNQDISLGKTVYPSIKETDNSVNYWGYTSFRMFFPVWENSELLTLSNGNKVLITPLRRNLNVNYGNLYYIRRLRIEFTPEEELVNVNIVEIVTTKSTVAEQKYTIIGNVFEELETRTDAKIMVFDAGYSPLLQNTSWQGEASNNSNLRGSTEGSSNGSDAPPKCYTLTAVATCSDIQYIQDSAACDDPTVATGYFMGFGTPINACGGGGSPYTPPPIDPNNPLPPISGGSGDTGQDQPFNFNTIEHNGVKIDLNYKDTITGQAVAVNDSIINAYKQVIDHPDFREMIKGYLPPDTTKLRISFDLKARGAYSEKSLNTIFINPHFLQKYGMIEMVNMLIHEGGHMMFFKINHDLYTMLLIAKGQLIPGLPGSIEPTENMIHHEAMGEFYLNKMIHILKAFDKGDLGKNKNNSNINDTHYRAFIIASLLTVRDPDKTKTGDIKMKLRQWRLLSGLDQYTYLAMASELRDTYIK